jgi:hypothetical protein
MNPWPPHTGPVHKRRAWRQTGRPRTPSSRRPSWPARRASLCRPQHTIVRVMHVKPPDFSCGLRRVSPSRARRCAVCTRRSSASGASLERTARMAVCRYALGLRLRTWPALRRRPLLNFQNEPEALFRRSSGGCCPHPSSICFYLGAALIWAFRGFRPNLRCQRKEPK